MIENQLPVYWLFARTITHNKRGWLFDKPDFSSLVIPA